MNANCNNLCGGNNLVWLLLLLMIFGGCGFGCGGYNPGCGGGCGGGGGYNPNPGCGCDQHCC